MIEPIWQAEKYMNEDEFKAGTLIMTDLIKDYQPLGLLSDTRMQIFTTSMALQEWLNTHVFIPAQQAGLRKVALLKSAAFIAQLSTELAIDEGVARQIPNNFFSDVRSQTMAA